MMNMVNDMYCNEKIPWEYGKNGELKKENYDACDSLICALAYVNINRYGVDKPIVEEYSVSENNTEYTITYTTRIWCYRYYKKISIKK